MLYIKSKNVDMVQFECSKCRNYNLYVGLRSARHSLRPQTNVGLERV